MTSWGSRPCSIGSSSGPCTVGVAISRGLRGKETLVPVTDGWSRWKLGWSHEFLRNGDDLVRFMRSAGSSFNSDFRWLVLVISTCSQSSPHGSNPFNTLPPATFSLAYAQTESANFSGSWAARVKQATLTILNARLHKIVYNIYIYNHIISYIYIYSIYIYIHIMQEWSSASTAWWRS